DHLRSLVTERTKVVAFPMASNAVGTITPAREIVEIAHSAGALAWVDAVHYAPHGDIEMPEIGCDVLVCSPYKFYGPHLGLAWVRRELSESWRPYKVRPQADTPGQRHETGTLPHELLCGFVACVEYLHGVGWKFISEHERKLGQKFLDGIPDGWTLHGPPTMEGRVSTFCLSPPDEMPSEAAARLGAAGFAVWDGNYYAIEVFEHLGLPDGAGRIGIVHTNLEDEVDRLLPARPRGQRGRYAWRTGPPRARRSGGSSARSRGSRFWCSSRRGAPSSRRGCRRSRRRSGPPTGCGWPGRRRPRSSRPTSIS